MSHSFVHLHTHSNYSLLDGVLPLRKLVERAHHFGMPALALTDHNNLYGAIEFYELCREMAVKPIIGAQLSLMDGGSLVVLAKNATGYRSLCEIISVANLRGGHLNFQCEMRDIVERRQGLVVLSGGKRGLISQLVMSRNPEEAEGYCQWLKEQFGDDFYLELQRFAPWDDFLNQQLLEISETCNVPLVATNDVHLLGPDDLPLREVLHAIAQNTVRERVRTAGSKEQYFKTPWEMRRQFGRYAGAIENTLKIAEQCNLELKLGKPIFPVMALPEGKTSATHLRRLCFDGAKSRYQPVTQEVTKRLKYELKIIDDLGFTDYFLIVKDIVEFCRREDIPCVGRGSAAGSIAAYVLGITFADPIRFNLYFERFLNPERTDAPDIDLDICWKNRDRVIAYVYDRFGKDKTAMICTFSTFQSRAGVRDVAKVFGLPEEEISELTCELPYMAKMANFDKTRNGSHQLKNGVKIDRTFLEILKISNRIAGFPRHLSIHSGGVIIAPDRITNYTPLEVAGKGIVISQYDMVTIERLGLVKMDLLGVRSLTIITECLEMAKPEAGGRRQEAGNRKSAIPASRLRPPASVWGDRGRGKLDLRTIPEDDPETIKMIKSGQTLGCFQLESPLVRGVLRKMQTDSVEDTVAAVAVIRPGVGDSGMKDEYILRRGGKRKARYSHPILEPVLKETYGLTIYQEQVLLIAQAVAGFTLAQGDILRRAMTKKRDPALMNSMRKQFIDGAIVKGVAREKALEIWRFLLNFTGFGFNKAHAATYGILAYQTAFLKRYFPIEFMTAVLNNHGGFYSKAVYIEECRRLKLPNGQVGIPLLSPDVNHSESQFSKEGEAIRVGLSPVYELTDRARKTIVRERRKRPFAGVYDFLQRTHAGEKETEHLIRCGALRSIHASEPLLLLQCQSYFKNGRNRNKAEYLTQGLKPSPYSKEMRLLAQLELLSFGVVDHPLSLYDGVIPWENMISSLDVEKHKDRRVQFTGWYVTSRLQETASGKQMKFLSLEDRQGICETVFFPEVYARYASLLRGHGPFTVVGKIQSRIKGEANLIAEKVVRWQSPREVVELRRRQGDLFSVV